MENYLLSRQPKLLSQTTLSCTWCMTPWSKWLHVRARGHMVPLCLVSSCLFSCTRSLCYRSFDFLKKLFAPVPSHAPLCQWKSTQESPATNCVFFLWGLQWMCATCAKCFKPNKEHTFRLWYMFIYFVYKHIVSSSVKSYLNDDMATLIPLYNRYLEKKGAFVW